MIIIRGQIQAFGGDVLGYIQPDVMSEIKRTDPKPLFKKYSVAHEGISKPRVIGKGSTPISWGQRAIRSVKDAIVTGIQCIAGHTKDNVKRGEKVVAQIVGKGEEIINGVLNAIVIGYFPNKDDADYDVISMEADLDWYQNGAGMGIAEGITSLSRFALGKSDQDIPAFQDAKLLGSIQCFDESEKETNKRPRELGKERNMDLTTIPFMDLTAELKRRQTFPTQVWTREEIIGDATVENGQLTFRGGDAKITSYLLKKLPSPEEVLKESKVKIDELEAKLKTVEPQIQELSKIKLENARHTAKTDILEYAKEKKLTEKQTKWIEENLDKYIPSDNKEESVKSFVDAQTTDFQRIQKLFPQAVENPKTKESESTPETTDLENKLNMY